MAVYAVVLAATVFVNSNVWITLTPAQAAREVYGRDPFAEAAAVAAFIHTHSAPTATMAVIG